MLGTGKTITFTIELTLLSSELKQLIYEAEGLPVSQQRLIFKGHQLEDKRALSDYGVSDSAVLHLILRLSCSGNCICQTGIVQAKLPEIAKSGGRRRIHKEMGQLFENVLDQVSSVCFLAVNLDRNACMVGIKVAEFGGCGVVYLRICFPSDYPFKPPTDFTVWNENVPHPMCGAPAQYTNGGLRATMLGRGSLARFIARKTDEWSPALTSAKLLLQFEVLCHNTEEELFDGEEAVYSRSRVAPPYDDFNYCLNMRKQDGLSNVPLAQLYAAIDIDVELPNLENAFSSEHDVSMADLLRHTAVASDKKDGWKLWNKANARFQNYVDVARATVFGALFPDVPDLVVRLLVRLLGNDLFGATEYWVAKAFCRERDARRRIKEAK